jgi:hypothetical protein
VFTIQELGSAGHFLMQDAAPTSHPLDVTRLDLPGIAQIKTIAD